MKQWSADNKGRRVQSDRRAHLKSRYGLTPEQFDAMLAAQHGVCAICRRVNPTQRNLAVDHDHSTGKVRGLLCRTCNLALGKMEDQQEWLRTAAEYLDEHTFEVIN